MIFLPTRGRRDNIIRFAKHYQLTGATEPVLLIIDHDDKSYDGLELPPQFSVKVMPPHGGIVECVNAAFADHPNETYYGAVADDVVPESPRWDIQLKNACLPYGISWANDGMPDIGLPTHPFYAGDLIRALGWFSCPALKHWYADNLCLDIANALGCAHYLPDVKLTHYHVFNGMAELDDTYLNQPSRDIDKDAYLAFKENDFPALIARIRR